MSAKYAFSNALKEVRFLFCQTAEHSGATRSFLARTYPTMKKHNPNTPIMLREAAGTSPKVYARYEFGRERSEDLTGTFFGCFLFVLRGYYLTGEGAKRVVGEKVWWGEVSELRGEGRGKMRDTGFEGKGEVRA
ncbi:hypothetical protein CJF32_00006404 [Rutstroemia sp. NJR-2017a WRK4]|nr:hypothetical protein CJF32_00006404 [Rutstroemia sp. NJR-2017a WRK4]